KLQSVLLESGLPIGDLAYYKAEYTHSQYWPVYGDLVFMLRGDVGYADGFSGKPLPFFKAFFAGGANSVRGYDTASLGPQDSQGNALGGRRMIVGNAEMFYPLLKGDKAVRASVFADTGEIWANGRQPQFESFRYSVGAGVSWNSPVGPLKFSYAIPLNKKPGDHEQRFQFQAGAAF
ncbi:MAG: BamA/TamA family outer membrane protein, partial [Vulcanimicrobiaceae bacterium]